MRLSALSSCCRGLPRAIAGRRAAEAHPGGDRPAGRERRRRRRHHGAGGAAGDAARRVPRPVERAARPLAHRHRADPRTACRHPRRRSGLPRGGGVQAGGPARTPDRLRPALHRRRAVHAGRRSRAGAARVPFTLRYQACDDKVCYAPSTARGEWTLAVVAPAPRAPPQHAEVFSAIRFGTGSAPAGTSRRRPPRRSRPAATTSGLAQLDRFAVVATTGGYQGTGDFMTFIRNAEAGVAERGLFEGRGPLAILLLVLLGGLALNLTPCVLPMIPINLAIIGAGAQAGSRQRGFLLGADLRRGDGVRLRRARPDRRPHRQHLRHHQRVAVVQPRHRACCSWRWRWRCSTSSKSTSRALPARVGAGASRGSFTLAFTMGGVAALLAGACVAPVVIQVVLFASNLYATGHRRGAGAAVLPRHRHGDPVADRRRRAVVAAQARAVDGPGEAGLRRR